MTDPADKTARRRVLRRGVAILRGYVAEHPLPFAVAVTGAAVYAGATVASAVVLGEVTDRVILPAFTTGVSPTAVGAGVIAILAVSVVRAGAIVVRRFFAGMTSARMQATLRRLVVDRYRDLPLAFHRSRSTGELLAHAEADVVAATEVLNPLPFSTAVLLLIVFATVALVMTDPVLTAIGAVIFPLLAALNRIYGDKVEAPAMRVQERIGHVSGVAHESFDGALVVKTLGREGDEVRRLASKAEALRDARVKLGTLRATFSPAFDALPTLGIVALLAAGAWRVSTGELTIGAVVRFVGLFQLVAFPMRLIGWVLSELPRAVVGRDRLEDVFTEPVTLVHPSAGPRLPPGPLEVVAESVTFSYGSAPVLRDLSFRVQRNETVALVGATASGKSTLGMLLARLADPDRGRITLGGVDLKRLPAGELRAAASIVFQESFLFAASVRDNITLGADAPDEAVRRVARVSQADGFISRLPSGYDTVVGERGVTLSGGQRQRIALARALLRAPRLLVLDDATSAVDPTVEARILASLRGDVAATTVIVAYRASTIAMADRVLFLQDGRIAADGPHDELLLLPAYERLVRAYARAGP